MHEVVCVKHVLPRTFHEENLLIFGLELFVVVSYVLYVIKVLRK